MRAPSADIDPHDGCYFERPPERLVLEGYRRWLAGYDSGSVTPWEMTQALYEELLGAAEGRRVLAELSHFVRTLRQCAVCPLRSFPFGAHHVCRDECVALGLIAALQHEGDLENRPLKPFQAGGRDTATWDLPRGTLHAAQQSWLAREPLNQLASTLPETTL